MDEEISIHKLPCFVGHPVANSLVEFHGKIICITKHQLRIRLLRCRLPIPQCHGASIINLDLFSKEYLKRGCPHSLRGCVWAQVFLNVVFGKILKKCRLRYRFLI